MSAKEVRHDRLVGMAAGAEAVETAGWAGDLMNYFAVMRSIRNNPELWFGSSTNPREKAKAIEHSIRANKSAVFKKRVTFEQELDHGRD